MTRIRTKACEHRQILVGGLVRCNDNMNPSLVRTTELFAVHADSSVQPRARKNFIYKISIV